MKGIIIYQTVYGSTRQYGEWISEKSGYKLVSYDKVKIDDLEQADTIIIGSYIFADRIKITNWVKKRKDLLDGKCIKLFTTSGAKKSDPKLLEIFLRDFKDLLEYDIEYYPFGGRQIFSKLNGKDKFLMKLAAKMQKDPKIGKKMLEDVDNFDISCAKALVESIGA